MAISTVLQKLSMATVGAAFIALGTVGIEKAEAITIGPDSYGYRATDEVPYTFENISGTGSRVLSGVDDATSSANLGFNFNFYGTDYNSVFFSPNGLMTFGSSNFDWVNTSFTGSVFPNLPSIAPFWDDLQTFQPGTDAVYYYQTVGTAGNRRFITQWNNVGGYFNSPSFMTFQAVLFEGSNNILFSYQDVDSGDFRSFGGEATVGIRNTNGNLNGQNLQWSYNSPSLRNGQSILISRVPEPASVLGLLAFGAMGAGSALKRFQQQKANV
ncbi:PEP-CTERM sorting domain-containing protein [Microseira wollei]|uniref:PEP-CTERM protein-sorting domain-containing protein n=1 Tax=Microseira wollei NIES-4236 TaxID=2530354 RepID=A0AAV3XD66_9CYAN|nr:PEP-CTERM sorting domain-containing protein [Microseira wollei]GET38287.1 hypothetical protein MiSe_30430 [Microseira wollei NIES-4236]